MHYFQCFSPGITAILAKLGLKGINGNLATAIRTTAVLFYFKALETGPVSKVAPIDKLSVANQASPYHIFEKMFQFFKTFRFLIDAHGAKARSLLLVHLRGRCGIHDYRNLFQHGRILQFFQALPSIHFRHIDIEKDQVGRYRLRFTQKFKGAQSIFGRMELDPGIDLMQGFLEKINIVKIIVNKQDIFDHLVVL